MLRLYRRLRNMVLGTPFRFSNAKYAVFPTLFLACLAQVRAAIEVRFDDFVLDGKTYSGISDAADQAAVNHGVGYWNAITRDSVDLTIHMGWIYDEPSYTGISIHREGFEAVLFDRFCTFTNQVPAQLIPMGRISLFAIAVHEIGHNAGLSIRYGTDASGYFISGSTGSKWNAQIRDTEGNGVGDLHIWSDPDGGETLMQKLARGVRFGFTGGTASAINGDTWLGGGREALPVAVEAGYQIDPSLYSFGSSMTHPYTRFGLMNAVHIRDVTRPFFSEVELGVFRDLGLEVDIEGQFGHSLYTNGNTVTNADGFDSTNHYGIGLHIVSDYNTVTQTGSLHANGVAGTGIRIEGQDNKVVIAPGATVAANGPQGCGVLVSHGDGAVLINRGLIEALGTGGVGVLLCEGDWGSFLAAGADRFDNSGVIDAGTNDAIQLTGCFVQPYVNLMAGTRIRGDISAEEGGSWATITFGKKADAGGAATTASDPTAIMTMQGAIRGCNTLLEGWGGSFILNGDVDIFLLVNGCADGVSRLVWAGGTWKTRSGIRNLASGHLVVGADAGKAEVMPVIGSFVNYGTIAIHSPGLPGVADRESISRIEVSGDGAQIGGGTLKVLMSGSVPLAVGASHKYVFLSAAEGGLDVSTPLSVVAEPGDEAAAQSFGAYFGLFKPVPAYDGTEYYFSMMRPHAYGSLGRTRNQAAFGAYLDDVAYSLNLAALADNGVAEVLTALDGVHDSQGDAGVSAAMAQLDGAVYGTMGSLSLQHLGVVGDLLADVMLNPGATASPGGGGAAFWTRSYNSGGSVRSDGNSPGGDHTINGVLVGIERAPAPGFRVGGYFGYGDMQFKTDGLRQRVGADSYTLGIYGTLDRNTGYVLGSARLGHDEYEAERGIAFAGIARQNEGRTSGEQWSARLEGGLNASWRGVRMQPFGALECTRVETDAFRESGPSGTALSVGGGKLESYRSNVGLRLVRGMDGGGPGGLGIQFQVSWMHEFGDACGVVSNSFSDPDSALFGPVNRYTVRGLHSGRDWCRVGGGLGYTLESLTFNLRCDLKYGEHQSHHTASGGVMYRF
jgi:uncharacterized protein with beta-barrel porin domain